MKVRKRFDRNTLPSTWNLNYTRRFRIKGFCNATHSTLDEFVKKTFVLHKFPRNIFCNIVRFHPLFWWCCNILDLSPSGRRMEERGRNPQKLPPPSCEWESLVIFNILALSLLPTALSPVFRCGVILENTRIWVVGFEIKTGISNLK